VQALLGDSDLDWGGSPSAESAPRDLWAGGPPLRSVISPRNAKARTSPPIWAATWIARVTVVTAPERLFGSRPGKPC